MSYQKTLIIAEAGVNHNGSIDTAKKMIDMAAIASVDIIKFQTFTADSIVLKGVEKADYQKKMTITNESQYEMIKNLELDKEAHIELIASCKQKGIEFLSSPFDNRSIDLLDKLGLKRLKIPSGEITNLPYLRHIGSFGKSIILSTGMSNLFEVEAALNVLEEAGTPRSKIIVFHCNTEYPSPMEDVNLKAMISMRDELEVTVGYSDHTLGIEVPIAAVAMGAVGIEKHFTLDRNLPGPDHHASLEPGELKAMVLAIRNIEQAMGDGVKKPSPSEIKNITVARKSIVAAKRIKKGDIFTEENLTTKRSGVGISPFKWDKFLGQIAKNNYEIDEQINE
jgi:N,N'-diacetyllegionaminate synthase